MGESRQDYLRSPCDRSNLSAHYILVRTSKMFSGQILDRCDLMYSPWLADAAGFVNPIVLAIAQTPVLMQHSIIRSLSRSRCSNDLTSSPFPSGHRFRP